MKRIIPFIFGLIFWLSMTNAKAQVWFPEGGYNFTQPSVFSVDNANIYTVGKHSEDSFKSYWIVAKYDGKSWIKLPVLVLNKTAEILEIKQYLGSLYVAGNFTFDNGTYSSIIRFKDLTWQPLVKLRRSNVGPISVSSLEIFGNKLLIGGNFNLVGTDSIPYLTAYNGFGFSNPLTNCKTCHVGGSVVSISANDSVVAVSGSFGLVSSHKTTNLFTLDIKGKIDTFLNIPLILDRLAINGRILYASGVSGNIRKLVKIEKTIVSDIRHNIDSLFKVNQLVIKDNNLWMNGVAKLTSVNFKGCTFQLSGSTWIDYSNNYPGAQSIVSARGSLWAIGSAEKQVSMWNHNRSVMRFFESMALVKARVFLDQNNDCILNSTDKPLPRQLIKLAALNRYLITNENGLTEFLIPNKQITYKFEVKVGRNFLASNCADTVLSKTFVSNRYVDSIQFPLKRRPNISDLRVYISSPKGAQVVKDKKTEYIIACENVGSIPLSGSIKLRKNSWLSDVATTPSPFSSSDTMIEWSYANLLPGERNLYYYSGSANDARFTPNTQLSAQAEASISAGSNSYIADDIDSIQQTIDNDVSPFRKDIYPIPSPGDSVSYLSIDNRQIRYNISFQNFNTDTVFNAVVSDTLDLNLDISYIQETGSNKNYYTEIQTDPNNSYRGILIWHFPNINLVPNPLKNFEQTESGSYIGFKVVMKPLSNGYIVKNVAAVFYDNTYSGKTNTAYCTILSSGLNTPILARSVLLYPNPASETLHIGQPLQVNDKIKVYNLQGQEVLTTSVDGYTDDSSIDIGQLSSGIYMVQIISANGIYYGKFIKTN
ncbi:MAG: T9SS type A sorting domain-containing protein [Bacteroidota bacterium]